MAEFAQDYAGQFSRIDLTIQQGQKIKRIELAKPSWRKKVQGVTTNEALKTLFAEIG